MPITITAADYIGTPPVTGISCPVDDEKVKGADLQNAVAALLANDTGAFQRIHDIYYRHPTPTTDTAPTYTNATNAFTDIAALAFVDPTTEEVISGDVIEIDFVGTAASTTEASIVRLAVQQEGEVSASEITGARVLVAAGAEVPVCITATFPVTVTGFLNVFAQGAKKVVGGSLTMTEAFRLEARRVRRHAAP